MTPIVSYRQWGIILAAALAFVLIPQLPPPNDWELNTIRLFKGLYIYSDQNFVYPPWGLILLWPYLWLTAPGTRIASVLVIGWLTSKKRWTLLQFGAIIISPYFLWTAVMSNVDVLALLLPILLWETAEGRSWRHIGRTIAWLLLLLKPQGGISMIIYLGWKYRYPLKDLLVPSLFVLLTVIPISVLGDPPLILQWMENTIFNPSSQNLEYWRINNVSLTTQLGWMPGSLIVIGTLGGIYWLIQSLGKKWTEQHSYASIFLISMLLGPYASNQGMIVPLALVGSWPAVVMQDCILGISSQLGIFRENSAWWALLLGIGALWFYKPASVSGNPMGQPAPSRSHTQRR